MNTLTNENIAEWATSPKFHLTGVQELAQRLLAAEVRITELDRDCWVYEGTVKKLLERAESAETQLAELRGQEPEAWRYRTTDIKGNKNPDWSFSETESLLGLYEPLYAIPVPPAASQTVNTDVDTEALKVAGWIMEDISKLENKCQLKSVIQCRIEGVLKSTSQPYTVPEEATPDTIEIIASIRPPHGVAFQLDKADCKLAADIWNACRGAMLQLSEKPQSD